MAKNKQERPKNQDNLAHPETIADVQALVDEGRFEEAMAVMPEGWFIHPATGLVSPSEGITPDFTLEAGIGGFLADALLDRQRSTPNAEGPEEAGFDDWTDFVGVGLGGVAALLSGGRALLKKGAKAKAKGAVKTGFGPYKVGDPATGKVTKTVLARSPLKAIARARESGAKGALGAVKGGGAKDWFKAAMERASVGGVLGTAGGLWAGYTVLDKLTGMETEDIGRAQGMKEGFLSGLTRGAEEDAVRFGPGAEEIAIGAKLDRGGNSLMRGRALDLESILAQEGETLESIRTTRRPSAAEIYQMLAGGTQ